MIDGVFYKLRPTEVVAYASYFTTHRPMIILPSEIDESQEEQRASLRTRL